MKGAEVWSICKESNEKSVCLLFCVSCLLFRVSAYQPLELCGAWQPARSLIWSSTGWPSSLLFSSFQTFAVFCSWLVSTFACGVCVPRILQFSKTLLCSRQGKSLQARSPLQSFPLALFQLDAGAGAPSLVRRWWEGKSSDIFSLFFTGSYHGRWFCLCSGSFLV